MARKPGLYVSLLPEGKIKKLLVDDDGEEIETITSLAEDAMYYGHLYLFPFEEGIHLLEGLIIRDEKTGHEHLSITGMAMMLTSVNEMLELLYDSNQTTALLLHLQLSPIYHGMEHGTNDVLDLFYRFAHYLLRLSFIQSTVRYILENIAAGNPIDTEDKFDYLHNVSFNQVVSLEEGKIHCEYHFTNEAMYMVFVIMHFIATEQQVMYCSCCANMFVPKKNQNTRYCDRIFINGKTCKQMGPRIKHIEEASTQKVIAEFDRAKQRMYKRYERTLNGKEPSDKDLSYGEYYAWLDTATAARDQYRAGQLSEEEALKIINVP